MSRQRSATWRRRSRIRALSAYHGRRNMGYSLKLAGRVSRRSTSRLLARPNPGPATLLQRFPSQLSGGQRQRVARVAPSCHPQVFLFDEPLSNLDAKLRVQMRTEIEELQQRLYHHRLRDPRPDRGHDHGRQDRGDARRPRRAVGLRWSCTTGRPTSSWPASSARRR